MVSLHLHVVCCMGGSTSRRPDRGEYTVVPTSGDSGGTIRTSRTNDGVAGTPQKRRSLVGLPEDNDTEEVYSVVQFSCSMYFCEEHEGEMRIDVVRLGDSSGEATAEYTTVDSSAKAGVKYEAQAGTVRFLPGETMKEITVPLLQNDSFDATLEFLVEIVDVKGAHMGKYLYTCRVKIIDDDVFPTNKYEADLRGHSEAKIPGFGLMMEYFKMLWQVRHIRVDSIKQVAMDQFKAFYFILTLYLQMYLVDVVLVNPKHHDDGAGEEDAEGRLLLQSIQSGARLLGRALGEEGEEEKGQEHAQQWIVFNGLIIPHHRRYTAMVIGLVYIVPFAFIHLIDLKKCYLCIPGAARKLVQANLLRRFLYYREDMRGLYGNSSEITMAMIRDVVEVVDFGYMKVLEIIRIMGKVICASLFILAENRTGVIPLVVYPFILSCYLICRERKTLHVTDLKAQKQDEVVSTVNEAINNYRLLADFHLRPVIVDAFEDRVDSYHDSEGHACAVITNNMYLAPWLTTITIGIYVVVGAFQAAAFGGPLSLGTFLATINVFKEVGAEVQEVYCECLEIQRAEGPLKKICHFLNLETDLAQHLRINRMRRQTGETKRQQQRLSCTSLFAADSVDIEVRNLSFQYVHDDAPVLSGITLSFAQGRLYAFVGPPHEGKATLLRLFGHVLLPKDNSGDIFVPPHLRILHVSAGSQVLFANNLLENIVLYGDLESLGGKERVIEICRRLGFSPYLMRELHLATDAPYDSRQTMLWTAHLSDSDFARLTMARGLVRNPECLVMHKPCEHFNDAESKRVARMLRNHVNERGLELSLQGRKYRRPRTVFMSSSSLSAISESDQVYRISAEGVWPIDKDKVDERLLS